MKSMLVGEHDYADELLITELDTLNVVLRKIDDDPRIMALWDIYLEKSQPFSIASDTKKWEEIKSWLNENQRAKYW